MKREKRIWVVCICGVLVTVSVIMMTFVLGGDLQSDLAAAAARGDVGEVKRLFTAGAKLDECAKGDGGECGEPALLGAAEAGRDDVVQFFIDHGADLEIGGHETTCPLAVALRHYSTAKLLLDHGASANHATGQVLSADNWSPPLEQKMVDLLKSHGAVTQTSFKRVPPSSFLCTGKVVTENEIKAFLNLKVPAIFAALESAGAKRSGLLHVNYTGRNLRHPGPFYIEVAVPFDDDKYQVPAGYYFRTANEFKCFTGETSGLWNNIRSGASIIESKLWTDGKAYPTYDMREVYRVWKSADSPDNEVEIQFGIHHPCRDADGKRYQEVDNLQYEAGE